MDTTAWVIVAVGVAVVMVLVYVRRARGTGPRETEADETDYRTLFIMGLVMLAIGIGLTIALLTALDASWVIGMPLVSVGLVFLTIGAGNRDKWSHR
jgi:hypothetical protein